MPVDIALPDVGQAVADFRQLVRANGRDPDNVEIALIEQCSKLIPSM
jgi:hypothetical protein